MSLSKIFERLETRVALAGDVAATVVDGALEITGDGRNNDIEIRQLASGDWQLTGRSNTEINGERRFVVTTEVTDIEINLRNGSDSLRMRGGVAGDLNLMSAAGDDVVDLQQVSVAGDAEIDLGAGIDFVKANRLDAQGYLTIRMGAGRDSLFMADSNISGDMAVHLGAGDDQLAFDRLEIGGDLEISAGDGNDRLSLRQLTMGGLKIAGGLGTDTATIDRVMGDLSASIDLGAGRDKLEISRTQFLGGIDIAPEDVTPDGRERFVPETVPDTQINRPTQFTPTGTSRNVTPSEPRTPAVPTQLTPRNTNPPTPPTQNRFGQSVPEQQAQQLIELLGPNWFYYGTIGR